VVSKNHVVHTILASTFLGADYSNMVFATNIGKKLDVPSYIFCITGDHAPVVVDASFRPEACQVWPSQWCGDPRQGVVEGLARIGVRPDDVGIVVLTHLHYDHCGQVDLFRGAKLAVQRRELAHAAAPYYNLFYYRPDIARFVDDLFDKIWLLDGDTEILPGIQAFFTGGHTVGHQGLFVQTAAGRVAMAGDIINFYDNLETRTPNLTDVIEVVQATERIRRESDLILASHDFAVLERYAHVGQPDR